MKKFLTLLFTFVVNLIFAQIPLKCVPNFNKLDNRTINFAETCNGNPYELVYNEEFDSPLNLTEWRTDYPYGCPTGNIHPVSPDVLVKNDNTFVSGGYLHMLAKIEDYTITCVNDIGQTSHYSAHYTSSVFHSNNNSNTNPNSDHESGCWRWGKFSIRAKIPHDNGTDGMFPSFWFFGWGGEVDVYEFIHGSDELETTIHLYNLEKDGKRPHYVVPPPSNTGHLSDDFHEYTFEWTPFKYAFFLDGVEYAQVFRFYEDIGSQPNLVGNNIIQRFFTDGRHHSTLRGLECEDIPQNQDFEVVYNLAWEKMEFFNLDMILGNTIDPNEFVGPQSEMLVDWIRVYQKTAGYLDLTNDAICANGESITLNVDNQPAFINWTTSPNLIITNRLVATRKLTC